MKLLRKLKSNLEENMGHKISYKMFFAITLLFPIYSPLFFLHDKISDIIDNFKYKYRINKLKRNKDINKIIEFIYDGYYSSDNTYPLIVSYCEYSIWITNYLDGQVGLPTEPFNIIISIKCKYQDMNYILKQYAPELYELKSDSVTDIITKMENTLPLFKSFRRNKKLSHLGI